MAGRGSATANDKAMVKTGSDWEIVIVAEAANLDKSKPSVSSTSASSTPDEWVVDMM
jgi:hypothetical protein